MPGVVINGKQEVVPDVDVRNWFDDPKFRLAKKLSYRPRLTRWVRGICLHTTKGLEGEVRPGAGPNRKVDEWIAGMWATGSRYAGAHLTIDADGSVGCHADLLTEAAYHAGAINEVSIGIEIYQDVAYNKGVLYEQQLEVVGTLCNWLTRRFGIQRQMPQIRDREAIPRIAAGGRDVSGVYGHRHAGNRGPGDPGDDVFRALAERGYVQYKFRRDDIDEWRVVQDIALRFTDPDDIDGVPGPGTVKALKAAGYVDGIFVLGKESASLSPNDRLHEINLRWCNDAATVVEAAGSAEIAVKLAVEDIDWLVRELERQ